MSVERTGGRDTAGQAMTLPIVWRVGRAGLAAAWTGVTVCVLAILAVVTWVLVRPDADKGSASIGAALAALIVVMLWRSAIHPSAEATEHSLVVRNPLQTVTICWDDVVDATAGYYGVTVRQRGGRPTTIWAVQKSNIITWRRRRARADEVASTIRNLATARATAGGAALDPTARLTSRRDVEPEDAFRSPLRFPWRMTRPEASVIGFMRHPYSPRVSAAAAALFAVVGLAVLGFEADDQLSTYLLHERGVVVQATVLAVPGQVKVVWPAIAPHPIFLDAGHQPPSAYPIGSTVDVLSDPQHPTRAGIVGVKPEFGSTVASFAIAFISLSLASGYAKWARWLAVTDADQPPSGVGRDQAGHRHLKVRP
ncbi:MAG TPA: hypothetical protein VGC04_04145 [Cellulomonas sp.]